MEIEDRKLAELYRLGTDPGTGRSGCLSAEETSAAASGRDRVARERALAHAGECAACAEELRLALGLVPWARRAGGDASAGARGRVLPRWLPAAAAVLIALGAGLWLRSARTPRQAEARRGLPEKARATAPADGQSLSAAPEALSWAPVPDARFYSVELYDAESTPIWSSGHLSSPRAELPSEVRVRLAAGGEFLWRITVYEEAERRDLPLERFQVTARAAPP